MRGRFRVHYTRKIMGVKMWIFIETQAMWILLGVVLVVITLLATIYVFSPRRNFEDGPRKGEAANPGKVKRQNPVQLNR